MLQIRTTLIRILLVFLIRIRLLLVTFMPIRILPFTDADPDPCFQTKAQNFEEVLKQAHIPYILACHLETDADPDQAYHLDADPDPQHCVHLGLLF